MKHIVKFESGYDCIAFNCIHKSKSCTPGKGGSHGRHGLSIRFVSKGAYGAVQFLLYTGWLPQKIQPSTIGYRKVDNWGSLIAPADLGYHSITPQHSGQTTMTGSCEFCDGLPCYYDGSGLNANDAMYSLVNGGEDALWAFLDAYYNFIFSKEAYPVPFEYPTSVRGEK